MQNLMLNRIKSISNPKNEKEKSSYALFLISLFHFENNLIKKRFFLFLDRFGQLGNFFQVSLKQKNQQKRFFAYQPRSKCTFLLYTDKI